MSRRLCSAAVLQDLSLRTEIVLLSQGVAKQIKTMEGHAFFPALEGDSYIV